MAVQTTQARMLVTLLALVAGVAGIAQGSIPEDPGPLWVSRYDGSPDDDEDHDNVTSLAMSPDGQTAFLTGWSCCVERSYQTTTVAYAVSSGAQLWVANGDYAAHSLAVSPDGQAVFVTGSRGGPFMDRDYVTVAYAASSGAPLWTALYDGPDNDDDSANSLAVSPDGQTVFVSGWSCCSGSSYESATIAYAVSSGEQLWASRHDGPLRYESAIAVSPDGEAVFVTGFRVDGGTSHESATVAYAAESGALLWAEDHDGVLSSLAVSPDGETVFVTGSIGGPHDNGDYATVAYAASNGDRLWLAHYDGPAHDDDRASSLAVSPDGQMVFVTGHSFDANALYDYATVAYAASGGDQLWLARYNGPGDHEDVATSLAVSPDGQKVFVTGSTFDLDRYDDYATVAYGAESGDRLWVAGYGGPADSWDWAHLLVVSPDGQKVVVTGSSQGPGDDRDYVTVAYRSSSCSSGHDEAGPVSGAIHSTVETRPALAEPYVHGANCDLVTGAGL